jgi:hypothetical protein
MRTVLFLAVDPVAIKEWWPVAKRLKNSDAMEPLFLLSGKCPSDWIDRFKDEEIEWSAILTQPISFIFRLVAMGRQIPGFRLFAAMAEYSMCLIWARVMLQRFSPAALILLSDRLLGWPTAFVKVMNGKGLPSFIISAAFPAAPGAEAVLRQRSPHFRKAFSLDPWLNRWAAQTFPKWAFTYNGVPTLLYPPVESIAATCVGLMPKNPWAFGGGDATRMFVESDMARKIFAQAGTKQAKMVVTGRPTVDVLSGKMREPGKARQAIAERYGVQSSQKIILCSVPHLKEHHLLSEIEHWAEMDYLFYSLTAVESTRALLCLHPGCRPEEYQSLAKKYGAVICEGADIYELLPACDIFVSTYSTIVNVAMGCLKPVVLVDFYGLNYAAYDDCNGVKVVRNKDELVPLLKRFAYDEEFRSEFRRHQEVESPKWVSMDGRNTDRIVEEILSAVKAGSVNC